MAATFGRRTTSTSANVVANSKRVSKFTVGGSAITIRKGAVLGSPGGTVGAKTRLVIYDDTGGGGAPGNLVAQSDEKVGWWGDGWNDYTFAADVTLSASTAYYFGIISDSSIYASVQATTGTNYSATDTYSDGAAATFGTGTTQTAELGVFVLSPVSELFAAKAQGVAVLTPPDGVVVPKALGLAVLTQEARIAVAKTYALAILDGNAAAATRRPILIAVT